MHLPSHWILLFCAATLLMAPGAPRTLAGPPGDAHKAPADPKVPQKLQKDAVIEIESAFFEVPEAEAKRLGLMSMQSDSPVPTGAREKKTPNIVEGGAETTAVLEPAGAERLLRAANKARGFKLLAAPRVTTRSGQRAVIEMIREFRYATEYEHDEKAGTYSPTAFETRNIGVTLEVEPVAQPEEVIDLKLVPQLVRLEGYMRASDGQPVPLRGGHSVGAEMMLEDLAPVATPADTILQPVFATRKVVADVPLFSGQSILLGGLAKDERQDGKEPVTRFLYVLITVRRHDIPAAAPEVLPVAFINKTDDEGFIRSPYAPEAKAIDARGLPSGTELKCPVTKKLFRIP
jgi:hypothetical protein